MSQWKLMPAPRVLLERITQASVPGPRLIFRENVQTILGVETVERVLTPRMEVPLEYRARRLLTQ